MLSAQTFIDIENTTHWQEQVNLLQNIQASEDSALLLNCPKNTVIIKNLLTNPRTKVVTTTSHFLIRIIEEYGPLLHSCALSLLGTDILFKLLNSSNKVIFASAHELIKSLIINCPHSKYYQILVSQLSSKNTQVRQSVSSYILVLADSIQYPSSLENSIKSMLADPSKIVRNNAQNLELIIKNKSKSKSQLTKSKPLNNDKQNIKPKKTKQLYITKQNKQKKMESQQIIIQSFLKNNLQQQQMKIEEAIQFLLIKINGNETWNMKMFAIEELCSLCVHQQLEDRTVAKILPTIVELIDQKRAKINGMAYQTLKHLLENNTHQFKNYLIDRFDYFITKTVRYEKCHTDLISLVINLDPINNMVKLAQVSLDIKSLKQKITILDILVEQICSCSLPFPKASIIIKLLCKHIQKYHSNKDIYLPCLAILSHFKTCYPNEFLGCLICLQAQTLSKIMKIAEAIDPHLKQAITNFINSLKGKEKNVDALFKAVTHNKTDNDKQLDCVIQQIMNEQQGAIRKLAQLLFSNDCKTTPKDMLKIIKLTEKVTSENSLIQLELLLQEISKYNCENYIEALFQAISLCDTTAIQIEYIVPYLRKVSQLFLIFPQFMHPKYAQLLISTYRFSKCSKIRLSCIKILSSFPIQLIQPFVNNKEKQLIEVQQKIQVGSGYFH